MSVRSFQLSRSLFPSVYQECQSSIYRSKQVHKAFLATHFLLFCGSNGKFCGKVIHEQEIDLSCDPVIGPYRFSHFYDTPASSIPYTQVVSHSKTYTHFIVIFVTAQCLPATDDRQLHILHNQLKLFHLRFCHDLKLRILLFEILFKSKIVIKDVCNSSEMCEDNDHVRK